MARANKMEPTKNAKSNVTYASAYDEMPAINSMESMTMDEIKTTKSSVDAGKKKTRKLRTNDFPIGSISFDEKQLSPYNQYDNYDDSIVDPLLLMEEGNSAGEIISRCYDGLLVNSTVFQKVAAELLATFILVFVGCGAAVVDQMKGGVVTHVGVAIAFGFAAMAMIYTTGHISGAHMNPAVTLALAVTRRFSWNLTPAYVIAQISASICASFALRKIFDTAQTLGTTVPSGSDTVSFFLELFATAILMLVISALATDSRAEGEMAGLAIGATITFLGIFAGPICGASMNPARSIGPAIVSDIYDSLWVYVIAPPVGAILAAAIYNHIRQTTTTDSSSEIQSMEMQPTKDLGKKPME